MKSENYLKVSFTHLHLSLSMPQMVRTLSSCEIQQKYTFTKLLCRYLLVAIHLVDLNISAAHFSYSYDSYQSSQTEFHICIPCVVAN